MNKTVTANISGIVFHIETEAYEKLHQYLSTIRRYFNDSDGTEEIMSDIEARIAELFKEKLGLGRDVITMQNVKEVIEIMGEPEQYMDEEETESYQYNYSEAENRRFRNKKLYRDEDDNLVGGVCSGLGYYFGVDRIWIRAAFLIAVFAGFGTGILIYIILWIIMPSAKTTGEKLEMRGEPINVENIGNTIKDEFNSFKKKVDGKRTSQYARRTSDGLKHFFQAIGRVFYLIFKFLVKVIAVGIIIFPIIGLITLLTVLVGGPFDIQIDNHNISNAWTTDMAELFFSSQSMFYIGLVGVCIVSILPLLGLIYGGLRILFEIPSSNKAINISAVSLFIIGVIMICVSASSTAAQHTSRQKQYQDIPLVNLDSDTLLLSSSHSTYSTSSNSNEEFYIEGDFIYMDDFSIDVIGSKTDDIILKIKKSANGKNRRDAGRRAENITVEYELTANELKVNPLISSPYEDKFRYQEARMSIALPVGKTIYLSPSSRDLIYDIENKHDMRDRNMIGHYWKMTRQGLICTDCFPNEINDDVEYLMDERRDTEEKLREVERHLEEVEELLKESSLEIKNDIIKFNNDESSITIEI